MDELNPEIQKIFDAKEARRKELADLSWPEKVKIIVEMQRRVAPLYRARGIPINVWEIEEPDEKIDPAK